VLIRSYCSMRKNLLEFLFGQNAVSESSRNLGEDVVKLFEDAAGEEVEQMTANKKPLAAALKTIGVSGKVIEGPQWCEIKFNNEADYRENLATLSDADNTHTLAELGWVVAKCGDAGMSGEAPDFKIGFIELSTPEPSDKDKPEDLEKISKEAQKFAATELERDDDMNPVETDHKPGKDGQKGIGKEKDGAKPEGKPKGVGESKKRGAPSARQLADQMLESGALSEMTGCSAIPAVDGPPLGTVSSVPNRNRFRPKRKLGNAQRPPHSR